MSSERIIDLADSSAKPDGDPFYRLNLLGRTIRGKSIDPIIFTKMGELLMLISIAPKELRRVWQTYYDSYFAGMTTTSSEGGWFIEKSTTTHIKNDTTPEIKKQTHRMFGGNNDNKSQQQDF